MYQDRREEGEEAEVAGNEKVREDPLNDGDVGCKEQRADEPDRLTIGGCSGLYGSQDRSSAH